MKKDKMARLTSEEYALIQVMRLFRFTPWFVAVQLEQGTDEKTVIQVYQKYQSLNNKTGG